MRAFTSVMITALGLCSTASESMPRERSSSLRAVISVDTPQIPSMAPSAPRSGTFTDQNMRVAPVTGST